MSLEWLWYNLFMPTIKQFPIKLLLLTPFFIFLLFYGYFNLYLSLLFLFGLFLYKCINSSSFVLPLVLMSIFSTYTLQHLGSTKTAQSYEVYNSVGSTTSIEFKENSNIDEICYYFAIDKNAKFSFSAFKEKQWKTFYSHNSDAPTSYQWICNDVNVTTKK